MLSIRNSDMTDFKQIMRIYEYAQDYMIRLGNPTQWGHFYPSIELIISDIRQGAGKVISYRLLP